MNSLESTNTNLTILLLTSNECDRIENILLRYLKYCKVIVLDNNSSDGTKEIATKLGVKVIQREKLGLPEKKDLINGVNQAVTEWVHVGVCSEVLTGKLLRIITEITRINSSNIKAIAVSRESHTWGKSTHKIRFGVKRVKGRIEDNFRFIKKSNIDWNRSRIHYETPSSLLKEEVQSISEAQDTVIHHFREGSPYEIEMKHALYADAEARNKYNSGERFSWLKLILSPLKAFLILLLAKPTIAGFICSAQHAQLVANIHLRLLILTELGDDFNHNNEMIRNKYED